MVTFVLISLLVGMVLGHRFKVLVLLPAIALLCNDWGANRWRKSLVDGVHGDCSCGSPPTRLCSWLRHSPACRGHTREPPARLIG